MVDLETMGIQKDAVILSIGAVEFDHVRGYSAHKFYQNVDPDSCLAVGMSISQHTVEFWGRPEQAAAREFLQKDMLPIADALLAFRSWILRDTNHDEIEMWCNGMFDLPILETAYLYTKLPHPWRFFNERDFRTMKMMWQQVPKPKFEGVKHSALADAVHQAEHLIAILKHIGWTG
jgi:exodeoxyribonuclease VIII